ncbi:heterokaryon incompatibility protein-domain-containing protein [Lasiosphaeria miniovina]|uniref:Heterokaryon incompatibility protein-domain-containing protein n=1 Tax=Lasiosphaeria miniovina TaxID=1954250 RepID=A0AA40EAP4_9PEZI|nr:heterokaryon incompatibility protein-domain-containing protein [Lasiosphaeria miniovina]KAK0734629.1 heterokaryon incompatibility protein-domain-containing protein [Lasiosphaeria miniovina]
MRLLDTKKLRVVEFADNAIPSYSILSHTWGDQEITYQDIVSLSSGSRNLSAVFNLDSEVKSKKGFAKVKNAAALAAEDGFAYLWIDTCCIDKASSAELSEAINSMYRWYEESDLCYAYLSDVVPAREELPSAANSTFRRSRWFTRGWTLQELLAPKEVRFFASDWSYLGSHIPPSPNIIGKNLLTEITSIDQRVLQGTLEPRQVSVATRMSWAASRETTRLEDIAYCLLGVFSVNMPLLYGEGRRAFVRLQEAILRETDDQSIFAWKSLSRDAPNHLSGLLADSPKLFQTARNIRALPPLLTGDKVPTVMSSQGLQVQLFLKPTSITSTIEQEE